MTVDLFIPAIVLIFALVALDILLLRARWHLSNNASFADLVTRITNWINERLNRLKAFLPKKKQVEPLTVIAEEKPSETATADQEPDLEASSPEIELPVVATEIGQGSTSDTEIQIPGSVVRVHITADVPAGSVVNITITTGSDGVPIVQQKKEMALSSPKSTHSASQFQKLGNTNSVLNNILAKVQAVKIEKISLIFFTFALLTYLATRFIGLTSFPIYFFGDEAVQTNSATGLIANGWKGTDGQFLPTYFQNGPYFNLSASVYIQAISNLLFGKSVLVTRGTSAVVSLLAALAVGLILRDIFAARRWWLATLLLSLAPAWFLHSRTAFETVIFASFYAVFLYFYLLYRLRNPQFIYPAVFLAGLTFYSYSPGQLVLAVTALLLFFSDIKYHWQNRKFVLRAIPLAIILLIPYVRFRYSVDYSPLDHLRQLGSYWILPISLGEKLFKYFTTYLYGLSPTYWFLPGAPVDLIRHQMRGYGNLPIWALPLFVIGIIITLGKIRESAYRTVLLALLATPAGAALAEIGITRVLVFIIPATIISTIGLDAVINWLESKIPNQYPQIKPNILKIGLSITFFVFLAAINFFMLGDALINGPTWFQDYGLYGMQYGSRQIFEDTVLPTLQADPQAHFVVSPSWANGTEEFTRFFIPSEYQGRVRLGQIYDLIAERPALGPDYYFVVTPDEFGKIQSDSKFQNVVVRSTIPLPTGNPGFYIINLEYADNIDAIMAEQKAERSKPVEETFEWNEQLVRVIHTPFGGGQLKDLMDGNPDTLAKSLDINPFVLDYYFTTPIPTSSVTIQTGSFTDFTVTVKLYSPESNQPVEYSQTFTDPPPDPSVTIPFSNGPAQADHVYISVKNNSADETGIIHIREITFK